MKQFFALALAFVMFVGGGFTLSQAQSPQVRQIILTKQQPAVVVAAGSAWGDHGTNINLSTTTITNDTANGTVNAFSSVRGTRAYSTGKRYFEIKVLTAPAVANFIIGVMDDTTANGAPMDDRLLANSAGHVQFNGTPQGGGGWNPITLGAGWMMADNDVMGYALDSDNGFGYLSLNCTYFLSGDPTSGAMGTGAVATGAMPGARPMLTLWGVPAFSGTHKLITTSAAFTCTVPTGYSAWNFLLKRDVMPDAVNDNTPMWMERAA